MRKDYGDVYGPVLMMTATHRTRELASKDLVKVLAVMARNAEKKQALSLKKGTKLNDGTVALKDL